MLSRLLVLIFTIFQIVIFTISGASTKDQKPPIQYNSNYHHLKKQNIKNQVNKQQLSDSNVSYTSNSYNFSNLASVSPESGTLSFFLPFGKTIGNYFGPKFTLKASYDPTLVKTGAIMTNPGIFGLGSSWGFNLQYYNTINNTLTLATGQTYTFSNSGSCGHVAELRYHKLRDIHVIWASYSDNCNYPSEVDYTNGNKIYFSSGDEYRGLYYVSSQCDKFGKCIYFNYNNEGELSDIEDENKNILYQIRWHGTYALDIKRIISPIEFVDYYIKLGGPGSNINEVDFVTSSSGKNSSINFSYCAEHTCQFSNSEKYLDRIILPSGLQLSYQYTELFLPNADSATVPAISDVIKTDLATNEKHTVEYHYDLISRNNYLGRNANILFNPNNDSLFNAEGSYEYGTTVNYNNRQDENNSFYLSKEFLYDKYHLLIKKSSYIRNKDNASVDSPITKTYYCYAAINGYCENTSTAETATSFDSLPASYTLATKTTTSIYDYLSSTNNIKSIINTSNYNDYGKLISETDPMGITKNINYCKNNDPGCPSSLGEEQYVESVEMLPSDVVPNSNVPMITEYSYNLFATKFLMDEIKIGYKLKNNNVYWMNSTLDYYSTNAHNPSYLTLEDKINSLYSLYPNANIRNLSVRYSYQFPDNKPYIQTTTVTPQQNHELDGSQSISNYYGQFTGIVNKATNEAGIILNNGYDNQQRLVDSKLCSANNTCYQKSSIYYEIYDADNENGIIQTSPTGFQTKDIYDGFGQITSSWYRDSLSGSWDELSSNAYDVFGHPSSNVLYNRYVNTQGIDGDKYFYQSRLSYDLLNRPIQVVSANGLSREIIYDDINNEVITFSITSDGGLTGVTVSKKNDDGLNTDKYIFPKSIFNSTIISTIDEDVENNQPLENDSQIANSIRSTVNVKVNEQSYIQHQSRYYDGYNRLISTVDSDDNAITYMYDDAGFLTNKVLPNGHKEIYTYEPLLNKIRSISIQ